MEGQRLDLLGDPGIQGQLALLGQGNPVEGYQEVGLQVGVDATEQGEPTYSGGIQAAWSTWDNSGAPSDGNDDAPPWLGEGVEDIAFGPWDGGPVTVIARVKRRMLDPIPGREAVEIESRLLNLDVDEPLQDWYEDWIQKGAAGVAYLRDRLQTFEAVEISSHAGIGQVRMEVSPEALAELIDDPNLAAVELDTGPPTPDTTPVGHYIDVFGTLIDGVEVESLLQSEQFYDAGYHAAGQSLGMVESRADEVYRRHPGFGDTLGNDRHTNLWVVPGTSATYNLDPTVGEAHATSVASLIIGDLTRGQDPSITDSTERRKRSGVARRAELYGVDTDEARVTYDMLLPSRDILATNFAFSAGDTACQGRNSWSRVANDLFEGGVLPIKSAGNDGNGSATNCQVTAPGSAIGTLTIGAYQANEAGSGSVIHPQSSRGGTSAEGRGRSILDLAAPTSHQYSYMFRGDCGWLYGTSFNNCATSTQSRFSQTSGAVPIATGAAALFYDWYEDTYSPMTSPGQLYTQMLLQGDGRPENPASGVVSTGYSNLWGAGRLRMRRWDGTGMDGPLRWTAGSRCVDHGETVTFKVTTSDVSSSVDGIRAVSYLYDSRHDNTSLDSDQVDLVLLKEVVGSITTSLRVVDLDASSDNKKRVSKRAPDPGAYYLRLYGRSVGSGDEGCGTNSTRVWWSYMHEDSGRQSHENLDKVRPDDQDVF